MYSTNILTDRQTEILNFLQEFQQKEGIAPTCREIADHFRFKSPKAVTDHLIALEKKGFIRRHGGRSRGIEVLNSEWPSGKKAVIVPIVGNIPAGHPEKKYEERQGTLAVDPAVLGGIVHHRLFALQVKGDSMEGRGINEGDWVVVDADATPRLYDVVVALLDGESTLKTLTKKKGRFFLKAENPIYPDRIPVEELLIQGVAKAILRRMS
jgi:repressor LexA